jgi:glycosyltransferase involved in cell wall biosynthesis
VITLTYKNFGHLKETVLSVLNQDYDNIEYIICDDCSPEFPEEKIRECIEKNRRANLKSYKILRQEKNVGTVKNINYAYHRASGDYFLNLSCGDVFFEKSTVSKIVKRIEENRSEILLTSRILYTEDFKPLGISPHFDEYDIIKSLSSKKDQYREFIKSHLFLMGSGSVLCVSRNLMETMGYYDEKYLLLEDAPFIAKALQKIKIDCCPDIVSIWYEQGGISTGAVGLSSLSPKLKKDSRLYLETELNDHPEMFSSFRKKIIEFDKVRMDNTNKNDRMKMYLSHPIIVLYKIIQKIKRKIQVSKLIKNDMVYIRKLLSERKEPAVDGC